MLLSQRFAGDVDCAAHPFGNFYVVIAQQNANLIFQICQRGAEAVALGFHSLISLIVVAVFQAFIPLPLETVALFNQSVSMGVRFIPLPR